MRDSYGTGTLGKDPLSGVSSLCVKYILPKTTGGEGVVRDVGTDGNISGQSHHAEESSVRSFVLPLGMWSVLAALPSISNEPQFAASGTLPRVHAQKRPELLLPETGPGQPAHTMRFTVGTKRLRSDTTRLRSDTTIFRKFTFGHQQRPLAINSLDGIMEGLSVGLAGAGSSQASSGFILL
jgi:hypothetical protein